MSKQRWKNFLKGVSISRTEPRRKGIPGGGTKKESLRVSREQLTVQLGKITEGRADRCDGQAERRALNARLRGPDLRQVVAGTFEGFKVK